MVVKIESVQYNMGEVSDYITVIVGYFVWS